MKYDCELIQDLLPLYQDKTASSASLKAVEEHLNECTQCRGFYQELKKTAAIPFEPSQRLDGSGGYQSLAKRLRRAKWYHRLIVALVMGAVVYLSLMAADGNRFDASHAATASHVIDSHSELMATVPMGDERILYIYQDDGLYRDVDVTYRFPYWKYVSTWPNTCIADRDAGVQLITQKSYANSLKNSLYIVYAAAVNDQRVAYIELGKEGMMQRQEVSSRVAVFYWDETGSWDGTDTWEGFIKIGELQGTAYTRDGAALYHLQWLNEDGQDSYQWVLAD